MTSNHQTTNFGFSNFCHEYFSAWAVEKETNFFIKTGFLSVLDQLKVCFLFHPINWEKSMEKFGENEISCLVVWCHEQDKNHK